MRAYQRPLDGIPLGGRLHQFYQHWTATVSHNWPLSVIKEGYRIQWSSTPKPWFTKRHSHSQQTLAHLDQVVSQFHNSKIIEVSPTQSRDYLSHLFLIEEPTKVRPVLDCTRINTHIQCHHFKMEGIPALRELIQEGDWMTKIDLKDAYTVVPIHSSSRPFLSFEHRGVVYQYTSLPFGMSVAPRVFSKLMRYALEPLRKAGIRLVYYLDDICMLGRTQKELKGHTQQLLTHLQQLGFVINWTKSVLDPNQVQEYLGFVFDTRSMIMKVPTQKIAKLQIRIRQALRTSHSCR